jgi:hypothetical protein
VALPIAIAAAGLARPAAGPPKCGVRNTRVGVHSKMLPDLSIRLKLPFRDDISE